MACSCRGKTFIVTDPKGNETTKTTEYEAAAMASRVGGSYRQK